MSIENGPREKLITEGADSLSTPELLAILMRTGVKDENVVMLSEKIFVKFDRSLYKMSKATLDDFKVSKVLVMSRL